DGDGFLDLFLTNSAEWTSGTYDEASHSFVGKGQFGGVLLSPKESNVLYHNNGDGTFTDVTAQAGLSGHGWAGDAVAFDFDGDGRIDLFVTSMFGRCQLYRNMGDGTFTDATLPALGRTPWGGVGAKLIDFNNDGRLDLFVVDMHSDMWMGLDREHKWQEVATRFQNKKHQYIYGPRAWGDPFALEREQQMGRDVGFDLRELIFGNALYRNEGGGRFTEISDAAGLETFWPWGVAVGDFDNDGHEDIFIPAGMGYPFYYWPNSLMMNQGDGTFHDRAAEFGIEPPARGIILPQKIGGVDAVRSSRCAVTGDFRGNGRVDLVVNNFNDQPYFLRNEFPQKNYIELRLHGTTSNRDAIGAVVRLHRGQTIMTRQILGACGYLSQSSKTIHFGLGDSPDYDKLEITWPTGLHQDLPNLPANTLHNIVEPSATGHAPRPAPVAPHHESHP
ncbi:MAG TPA: CRTAC1 family protein, partial [Gemmataceae bacterium]|nr:CRTAC1 family protein [Gemmataceae bacterium]